MCETRDPPDRLALLEAVAAALREELGATIEEQPGFHDADEAGQVNRAYRIVARTILATTHSADDDLGARLSDALRRLARRRLEIGLLDAREVEHLLWLESDGRDDWRAFLIVLRLWPMPAELPDDPERVDAWVETITGMELDQDGALYRFNNAEWRDRRERLRRHGGPPAITADRAAGAPADHTEK
jgi:hypothetical protein